MHMRKTVLILLSLCLAAGALLTACGNDNAGEGNEGTNEDVVHLTFWGAVPEEYGPAEAVENWNKANPDIQVEYKRFVNDEAGNTKLETALLAGSEVDIFVNYRMDKVKKRVDAGMIEPLDSFIEKDNFDVKENFGENAVVKFDEQTYYIPAIILNDFVTINQSFLEEANLEAPTSWTWDDYKEYAAKMTKGEGANKRWGSYVDILQPKIFEYLQKAVKTDLGSNTLYKDNGLSNFDHPAFKKYFDIMYELEQESKAQPPYAQAKASKMEGIQLYLNEEAAMVWCGTASLRQLKNTEEFPRDFKTVFAPPPKLFEDSQYVGGDTGYLDYTSISSRSNHKEEAWKFLKWYVTEGNEPLIAGGRVPAWTKADKDKITEMILGENPEETFDVESFQRVVFADVDYVVDTKFDALAEIQKIVDEEGERALMGEQSTEEAVENMKKRSDEILNDQE